jgi:hypothetical protein
VLTAGSELELGGVLVPLCEPFVQPAHTQSAIMTRPSRPVCMCGTVISRLPALNQA